MLSHTRKIIEGAVGDFLLRTTKVLSRHFVFQKQLSPLITLTDVDTLMKHGMNKIATFDLTKAYDRVNRKTLVKYFKKIKEDTSITKMLKAFSQPLQLSAEAYILGTEATQRLNLM